MKNFSILFAILALFSCKTSHFKGGKADGEAPQKAIEQLPEIPIASDTGVLKKAVPGQSVQSETSTIIPASKSMPRVLTLTVSRLKHDSLYKNCLKVIVEGQSYPIACNKDFGVIPPKVITLPNNVACLPISIKMDSFKPMDQDDCIKKIQANRQQHECVYQKEAFHTSVLPDAARFQSRVLQGESERIQTLEFAFEDSQDADFNDYTFTLTAGPESYIERKPTGVEILHSLTETYINSLASVPRNVLSFMLQFS